MKIIRRALCALAFGPAFTVYADFSWELAGALGQADRSESDEVFGTLEEFESDMAAVSAAYYFDPVEDGTGPYALVAFFDPATRVSVAISENRETNRLSAPGVLADVEREIDDYSVAGVYLFSQSRWYAGGRYGSVDFGQPELTQVPPPPPSPNTIVSSIDGDRYGLLAGKYFGSGATRLELSLDRAKTETDTSITFCALRCVTFGANAEAITDTARLGVMHVRRFRSATYALLGEISEIEAKATGTVTTGGPPFVTELEPVDSYSVGAELYPIPAIGVRLGYVRTDLPLSEDEDVSVGASWFSATSVRSDADARELRRAGTDGTSDVACDRASAVIRCPVLAHATLVVALIAGAGLPARTDAKSCDSLCVAAAELVERFELREGATPVRERASWERPKKIVVADVPLADYLRTIVPGLEIVGVPGLRNYSAMAEAVAGADVLVGLCTPEIVARGTSLKWIQLLNAGADSCATIPAVAERGILVTNLQRIQGPHMAEHAIAMLLSLARALPVYAVEQNAGAFTRLVRRAANGPSRSKPDACSSSASAASARKSRSARTV
jgi:hypothetical protein